MGAEPGLVDHVVVAPGAPGVAGERHVVTTPGLAKRVERRLVQSPSLPS